MSDDDKDKFKVVEGNFGKKEEEPKEEEVSKSAADMFEALAEILSPYASDGVEAVAVIYIDGEGLIITSNVERPDTACTILEMGKFQMLSNIMAGEASFSTGPEYDDGGDDDTTWH